MIYFDNAATSRRKPERVYESYLRYAKEIGVSPGRGSYALGITASRMLYQCRKTVAEFFGIPDSSGVVFTKNSTEAINLFLNGYLENGDHVILSPFEHNAVFRPLHYLKEKGRIDYTVLPECVFYESIDEIETFLKPNTRLGVFTLASNLTGQIVFSRRIAERLKKRGIEVFVDASQGAGKLFPHMTAERIDYLAFTGHKDLLGLPGVGGLCSRKDLRIPPLIQGGTGIRGDSYTNPDIYPDAYEAGTLNMPAIWALKSALEYLGEHREEILEKEQKLTKELIASLGELPQTELFRVERERVSTCCFRIRGQRTDEVVKELSRRDICVRGGVHCAVLAHETLGTLETGTVRVSLNHWNTQEEIQSFFTALKEMTADVPDIL